MKTSILEHFAYGNINPAEQCYKETQHYKKTLKKLCEYGDKLQVKMDEEMQELFQLYIDAQEEAHFIGATNKFIYGYRLGVLMTAEVFIGRNNVIFGEEDK